MVNNIPKFEGRMIEKGFNYQTLSTELKITPQTLSKKVKSKYSEFYIDESIIISNLLGFTQEEYLDMFVQNLQVNKKF